MMLCSRGSASRRSCRSSRSRLLTLSRSWCPIPYTASLRLCIASLSSSMFSLMSLRATFAPFWCPSRFRWCKLYSPASCSLLVFSESSRWLSCLTIV